MRLDVTGARDEEIDLRETTHATAQTKPLAVLAMCLNFFMIQVDATIVNVALPAIQRDLGGTTAVLQWIIASYTVSLAALMLTAGALADQFVA